MAVFTPVSRTDTCHLLQRYDLGELVSLRGITAGIENTNYFLDTTRGRYVLTLFEVLRMEELPFYIGLMNHLAARGVPVPDPQMLRDGTRLTRLHDKPTAIVTRLPGTYEPDPGPQHCARSGEMLAQIHLAARDFTIRQPNLRGLSWWQQTAPRLHPYLDTDQSALLGRCLDEQAAFAVSAGLASLPAGPAHCDFFRDNVLFMDEPGPPRIGGVIDFYFAGWDSWLFDVAVAVNDWCIRPETGAFITERLHAWLQAYHTLRPFTAAERAAWPVLLRAAALRFWISRLFDFHQPRPAQALTPHDPRHFEKILRLRCSQAIPALPS